MNPKKIEREQAANRRDREWLERDREVERVEGHAALPRAASNDPCRKCEVPGFRGCAHQRPYIPAPVKAKPPTRGGRHAHKGTN